MAERLSPEDSRILALESGSIVGHTCKVVIADRTGDGVTYLRDRIARRIALAPSCRRRIVMTPHDLDAPVWADDPNFDVRRHVRRVPVAGPVGDAELREIVARLMAERLPRPARRDCGESSRSAADSSARARCDARSGRGGT